MTGGNDEGVTTRLWRGGELVEEGFPLTEVSERLAIEDGLVWVDLCDPDHEHLRKLAVELDLDTHAVEDAILAHERPKATLHATHTFLTVYAATIRDADPGAPLRSRLELGRVSAFVLPRGIVTVRADTGFDMGAVEQRWQEDQELLRYGVGALVHGLLDVVVDGHFETIQQLDQMIEGLEDVLFDERASSRTVQARTYQVRKELVELRRVVLPMREVVNAVLRHRTEANHHASELDGYFTDLYDHVLRASEWTESLRDMVTTVFETNLSLQDARLNTVMKKLTGWAAIIAVPTAVTGWFGMNVPYPGFGKVSGFLASAGVIVGLGLLLYTVFKRKDWI
ncbi:MAG TPA: magnesium transporter CorA family protein [Intrasporangium sp.]|nr:magnesium transporter CorA family protein [Intrasporangium sp.]